MRTFSSKVDTLARVWFAIGLLTPLRWYGNLDELFSGLQTELAVNTVLMISCLFSLSGIVFGFGCAILIHLTRSDWFPFRHKMLIGFWLGSVVHQTGHFLIQQNTTAFFFALLPFSMLGFALLAWSTERKVLKLLRDNRGQGK